MAKPKMLIMAGGTGGHVFPALAVAKQLLAHDWDVQWLGTQAGIEARVVPANGIQLNTIDAVGLRGKSIKHLIKAPFALLKAQRQALQVFRSFEPDVVLGMGGFASGPGGLAAKFTGVPLVIHEQNAIAGTTNKILSKLATRVLSAFPNVFANGEAVGNPVREDIAALAAEPKATVATPLKLLVLGGSLGAQALNKLLPEALALLPENARPQVVHQTGSKDFEQAQANYQAANVTADVRAFIDDMGEMYQWADVAVCRAGAMTVSELACAKLPALLVPFPFAIDDHQTANGMWLVDAGASWLTQQKDLTAAQIAAWLTELSAAEIEQRQHILQGLARPESARAVAAICAEVAGRPLTQASDNV